MHRLKYEKLTGTVSFQLTLILNHASNLNDRVVFCFRKDALATGAFDIITENSHRSDVSPFAFWLVRNDVGVVDFCFNRASGFLLMLILEYKSFLHLSQSFMEHPFRYCNPRRTSDFTINHKSDLVVNVTFIHREIVMKLSVISRHFPAWLHDVFAGRHYLPRSNCYFYKGDFSF